MNIISTYREVGTYRGAAELCGTTHKTVKRVVERAEAGGPPQRVPRSRNFDQVQDLVAERVATSGGRISAKRLLPIAVAAGYEGSARNFRRLVAEQKVLWRRDNHRGRRPAVWSPGEYLVIDWAEAAPGLFVFCAVLVFSRWRFVRLAADQKATTTLAMIAEALIVIGGPGEGVGGSDGLPERRVWSPTWSFRHRTMSGSPAITVSARIGARPVIRSPRALWNTCAATPSPTWWCRC
jgi:hypothetical protein